MKICLFELMLYVPVNSSGHVGTLPPLYGTFTHNEDVMTSNKCFFEVNTKYISSSELKTSEFSRVSSSSENSDVFNSLNEIYLVLTSKKQISAIYFKWLNLAVVQILSLPPFEHHGYISIS